MAPRRVEKPAAMIDRARADSSRAAPVISRQDIFYAGEQVPGMATGSSGC
jgi:hypothetical protein